MRLGRQANIWRDSKLSGNDIFSDETTKVFPKTALLISVVTPRYVRSEWCTREVKEFCKAAENTGGLVFGHNSRALKVYKIPVADEDALPDVMKKTLGYPFFVLDEQQMPIELDPAYGDEFTQKYHLRIAKLAVDIAQMINELEGPVQHETVEAGGRLVYLICDERDRKATIPLREFLKAR